MRDYRQQSPQQLQQQSPAPMAPTQVANPHPSTVQMPFNPPSNPQPPRSAPLMPPAQQPPVRYGQLAQGLVANTREVVRRWTGTMEAVRRWTGKVAAMNNYNSQQPPPAPLVLYHPTSTPSGPLSKTQPWKRSRTLRLTMQRRRHRRVREQHKGGITGKRIAIGVVISILLLIVTLTSSGAAYGYGYYQGQLPKLQALASQHISQTTRIYDRHNVPLYDSYDQSIGGGRRTPVDIKYIPQVMQDAMTSAEDPTFWTNSGFDPQGVLRAVSQAGSTGGSGITQQLIKNLRNDDQRTLDRKVSELALSIGLTQQYPKAKILEMYLNVSGFGSQDLGVEAAVEEYFHLEPQCDKNFKCIPGIAQLGYNPKTKKHDPVLALAEASFLAGMPQNPVSYDPTLGPSYTQRALNRQVYVLGRMVALGITVDGLGTITPDIAQQAENLMAKWTFTRYRHTKLAPHFVDWVVLQMEAALGGGQQGVQAFLTGGFNIITTIDLNLENYVEAAVKRHLTQPDLQLFPYRHIATLNVDDNVNDAAVVVIDAKTGQVLAMDGSADYNSTDPKVSGSVNAATSGRGPGSSFKPIAYATAFEMGWYPG
ncbi:MAG: transglycosylase domain-containing protein, partial [Chloroflexi bacterium]|nr:transglycosylase domain-containing protein [Chloroflexota bacterium]